MKATKKALLEELKNIKYITTIAKKYFSKETTRQHVYNNIERLAKKYNIECYVNPSCTNMIPPQISKDIFELKKMIKYEDSDYYKNVLNYPVVLVRNTDDVMMGKYNLDKWKSFLTELFSPILKKFFTDMYKDTILDITRKFDNIENFKIFMSSELIERNVLDAWIMDLDIELLSKWGGEIISNDSHLYNIYCVVYKKEIDDNDYFLYNVWYNIQKANYNSEPIYYIVLDFDLNNNKKYFFLASYDLMYIKNISNIKDLAFYTNIRNLNRKINENLLNIKYEARKKVLKNIINLHLSKCKDCVGTLVPDNCFDIEDDPTGKYPARFQYVITSNANLEVGVNIVDNLGYINNRDTIEKISNNLTPANKDMFLHNLNNGIPYIFSYDFNFKYNISITKDLEEAEFDYITEKLESKDARFRQFLHPTYDLKTKKAFDEISSYIRDETVSKYFKITDKFTDVLYNKDKIDEILKQGREYQKNKIKEYTKELSNILKNKNNKSFLDIITILLYKEVLTNDMICYETLCLYSSEKNN
jgi:hypothetical protein